MAEITEDSQFSPADDVLLADLPADSQFSPADEVLLADLPAHTQQIAASSSEQISHLIAVEFEENDGLEEYQINDTTTFKEIKEMIHVCCPPEQLMLWWMGREMQNHKMIKDEFPYRSGCRTTLHCGDRVLYEDREAKRRRTV